MKNENKTKQKKLFYKELKGINDILSLLYANDHAALQDISYFCVTIL